MTNIFGKIEDKIEDVFKKDHTDTTNTQTDGTVVPVDSSTPVVPTDTVSTRTHVVSQGETLSDIAKQCYGDASKYGLIYDANRDVLDDPDTLKVGQELRIPEDK